MNYAFLRYGFRIISQHLMYLIIQFTKHIYVTVILKTVIRIVSCAYHKWRFSCTLWLSMCNSNHYKMPKIPDLRLYPSICSCAIIRRSGRKNIWNTRCRICISDIDHNTMHPLSDIYPSQAH